MRTGTRRCERLCISLAASKPMVDFRKTSGLTVARTGKVFSSTKSLSRFSSLGTSGRKMHSEISILTRWSVPRRPSLFGTGRPHSRRDGKRTADIPHRRWRSALLLWSVLQISQGRGESTTTQASCRITRIFLNPTSKAGPLRPTDPSFPGLNATIFAFIPLRSAILSPDEDPNHGLLTIHNRPPGQPWQFPAKDIVDGGFLELVRYGVRKPDDPLVEDSLRVVDAVLKVNTPFGSCWRRYNHDGYGTRPDGGSFEGWGQGRAWPLLTGERAHYEFAAGRDVRKLIRTVEQFAFRGRMLPEQVWDGPDVKSAGMYFGQPAGSAMPLMWAHAEYVKLLRSVVDGRVFDLIPVVAERYLKKRGRKDLEVWKPTRQVREVTAGQVLRIQAPESFRLHWTNDGWVSASDTPSTSTGLGIEFADIAIHGNQSAPVEFTFFWTGRNRWEGHNYQVRIQSKHASSVAA